MEKHRWTHSICVDCWNRLNPDREAHHLVNEDREPDRSCFCLNPTSDGIYIRRDPKDSELRCER